MQNQDDTHSILLSESDDPYHQRHVEALANLTRSIENTVSLSGPWDLEVGCAFCSIGNIYTRMGMIPEALAMYEKDLEVSLPNATSARVGHPFASQCPAAKIQAQGLCLRPV